MDKKEFNEKKSLITDIIQACAANGVPGLDTVFMDLICLDLSAIKKIAYELYIKTN
jgi:hypothetical protein